MDENGRNMFNHIQIVKVKNICLML